MTRLQQDPKVRQQKRATDRVVQLKYKFGLSLEDWLKMYDHQGGVCPICKKKIRRSIDEEGKKPSVDHDHKTGLVRGLLCQFPCNYALGHFEDNLDLLKACVAYLENPPATEAFGQARYTAPGKVGTKKRTKLLKKSREKAEDFLTSRNYTEI